MRGIRALMMNHQVKPNGFVDEWVHIAKDAKARVFEKFPDETNEDVLCRHGELESIITSIKNLRTFPFVESAIQDRGLSVMGIYFDLELGQLLEFDEESDQFKNIEF